MTAPQILYDVAERIGTITLNRPEIRNAFGGTMREELLARLQDAEADAAVRCVVVTGAGEAFCAGGDIAQMAELQALDDAAPIAERIRLAGDLIEFMRNMSKPVVAAVNGAAAGGGMNLALACDMRFASARAKFAESFVKIGLVPDWGGHYLLPRLVGAAKALELMLLGDQFDAATALRLGVVNQVFPDASFREDVLQITRRLAAGPPAALAAIKRGVYAGASATLADTLAYELQVQCELFLGADAREGMRAFIEKRAPKFGA